MPKFIVVIRFDGREIHRRGFVHKDAAMVASAAISTASHNLDCSRFRKEGYLQAN